MNPDDEDDKSFIRIESRYLPVPIKLDPRESVNSEHNYDRISGTILMNSPDQGLIRVDLLDGHSIHAADRGGMSTVLHVTVC